MAIAPALLPGRIPDGDVLFCGDGVAPFGALFLEALGDRATLVSGDDGLPRASSVGIVGERIFRDGGAEDPRTAVPFYLRSTGVERRAPVRSAKTVSGEHPRSLKTGFDLVC